ncbi:MAG: pyridoxamine 5'-phosphate oxidase family protein [Turicibacter sp.]|nr:pyridoxamine 5'-phosphate oxidase family protein [Turicibacter sp.]
MENILEFVTSQKITYLATIDNDQARVRPMGKLSLIDGKLAWCTNSAKDVFKQVAANPKIEFSMFGGGKNVRLSGNCLPTKDDSFKEKFIADQPHVVQYYGGGEGTLEVMVFEQANATVTAKGAKEVVALY